MREKELLCLNKISDELKQKKMTIWLISTMTTTTTMATTATFSSWCALLYHFFYLLFGTSASIETVIIVIKIRYCSKRICSVSFYGHNLFITLHFNVNPNLTPFSTSLPFKHHRQHFDRNQNLKKGNAITKIRLSLSGGALRFNVKMRSMCLRSVEHSDNVPTVKIRSRERVRDARK